MADAEPGAGNIPLHLDGKDHELVPTAGACMTVSRIGGGINGAVQRCRMLDMDTIVEIVKAGLGLNPTQAKLLPDAIYKTGLAIVSAQCIDYCNVIMNGGRPLDDTEEGAAAELDPRMPASR